MTCRPSEPCGAAECEWCADQTSGPPDDDAGLFDAIVAEIERREVSRPTGMPLPVPVDLRRGSRREVFALLCERIDTERKANPPPKPELPPLARWRWPWGPLEGVARELERRLL